MGEEISRPNSKLRWLVTRIVRDDEALVVNADGQELVSSESYVLLKSEDGQIDFITLSRVERPLLQAGERKIPALPNLWRKHAQSA